MKTFLLLIPAGLLLWAFRPAPPEPKSAPPVQIAERKSRASAPAKKTAAVSPGVRTARPGWPAPPPAVVSVPPSGPIREITRHDDRMTDWLLETGQRVQNLRLHETSRRPGSGSSTVIEGVSDEGHSLKEHVDAEGRLIADEVIFRDGRKLSRLYHPDGTFKAVYFEQSTNRAYSSTFDELGHTIEVTELTPNGKQTRRNSQMN